MMAMAASSRRLFFSSSFLHIRQRTPLPNATPSFFHKPNPSLSFSFFTKLSPSSSSLSSFQTHNFFSSSSSSSSSSSATASIDENLETSTTTTITASATHPWPEWVRFVDILKTKGYLDDGSTPEDDDKDKNDDHEVDSTTGTSRKDLSKLKNACFLFARQRFDILKSLSRDDIQTVVGCGCPNLLRKAVNSAKRLRSFVRLDEGDVCGACNLRGSCDRAYLILKDEAARTVDILRMLLIYAVDPLVVSGGEKPPGREQVEVSVRKLLVEVIELSEKAPDPALPKPSVKQPKVNEQSEKVREREPSQSIEMKRGDWLCSKCNFMNFSRNIRCLQCKEEGPKRVSVDDVEMKKGDWNCPQCHFMNFARNTKCLRCQESRPKRQLNPGEWECPSCDFLNYRKNVVCLKCDCQRPKNEVADYEDQIWRRP